MSPWSERRHLLESTSNTTSRERESLRSAVCYIRGIILANHLMENMAAVESDADAEMRQSIVYHTNGDSYSSSLPSLLNKKS